MVKNGMGGNKAKKNASKNFNINDRNVRYSTCIEEKYAVVTKMLGNNMVEVMCIDGKERQCVIRGKFSGRGKRQNKLSKGVWVLVGLRDWEISTKNRCDLLEVYTENDKQKIIKNENEDFSGFFAYDENHNISDNINFSNNIDYEDSDDDIEIKNNDNNDYFNFESSSDDDSISQDNYIQKKEELNDSIDNTKNCNISKISDRYGEINLDDI